MLQIRKNVFETNSSSVHSCCVCTDDEYNKWFNGEVYLSGYEGKQFVTKEEALDLLKSSKYVEGNLGRFIDGDYDKEELDEFLRYNQFATIDNFGGEYETDETTYTTSGGEKLHILCYYGHD